MTSDRPAKPSASSDLIAGLSPRRREVLELIGRGLTNEDIALAMNISPTTVRTHVTTILDHLGAQNRTEAAAMLLTRPASARVEDMATILARPAIAVLPTTCDQAPGSADMALALSLELPSLFARWCWFPVIARSSTANARALGQTAREIGAALRARFLVDTALQATPRGWRLHAQADDVEDGHCLWSDRFDFAPDPFDALEKTCNAVVATVYPVLVTRVQKQLRHDAVAADLEAWEVTHRAIDLQSRRDLHGNLEAAELALRALAREPTLVLAHFCLGLCAYDAVLNQWEPAESARSKLAAAGERCIHLAPHAAEGYFLLGRYHQTRGDHAAAIEVLETAIAKNPSFAVAHALLAQALNLCGRSDEGLVRMQHALRLGPRSFVAGLATLHFSRGEFGAALECAERAIAITPRYTFARVIAAAAAWRAGEVVRGRDHLAQLRAMYPAFDPRGFLATFGVGVQAVEQVTDALHQLEALVAIGR